MNHFFIKFRSLRALTVTPVESPTRPTQKAPDSDSESPPTRRNLKTELTDHYAL
jgi:hypothetical protein